jgi:hypothetical protein
MASEGNQVFACTGAQCHLIYILCLPYKVPRGLIILGQSHFLVCSLMAQINIIPGKQIVQSGLGERSWFVSLRAQYLPDRKAFNV